MGSALWFCPQKKEQPSEERAALLTMKSIKAPQTEGGISLYKYHCSPRRREQPELLCVFSFPSESYRWFRQLHVPALSALVSDPQSVPRAIPWLIQTAWAFCAHLIPPHLSGWAVVWTTEENRVTTEQAEAVLWYFLSIPRCVAPNNCRNHPESQSQGRCNCKVSHGTAFILPRKEMNGRIKAEPGGEQGANGKFTAEVL